MINKAKILLFSHVSSTKSITGAEKFLLLLAFKLLRYFDPVIVAPEEGELTRLARERGIRIILCRFPSLYSIYAPEAGLPEEVQKIGQTPAYDDLVSIIKSERASAVMTNTCVNVLPALAAVSLGIPVIWNVTEVMVKTPYIQHSMDLLNRLSSRIIAISDTVHARLKDYIPAEKLGLLYPSWDGSQFHTGRWEQFRHSKRAELGLSPDHKLVGFISSFLTEGKGLEHFIDMALTLCEERQDVRFLVIGQKNEKNYYKRCLDKLNASKYSARFTFVPYEKSVEPAYCAMDVLVIPSLMPEGFGLTALEGMIHGKLTCAYEGGGLSEVLGACGFGPFLAERENKNELTLKASNLLNLPADQAAALSSLAREKAEVVFGPAAYEQRLRTEVQAIAAARRDRLAWSEDDGGIVLPAGGHPEYADPLPLPAPEEAAAPSGRVSRRRRKTRHGRSSLQRYGLKGARSKRGRRKGKGKKGTIRASKRRPVRSAAERNVKRRGRKAKASAGGKRRG